VFGGCRVFRVAFGVCRFIGGAIVATAGALHNHVLDRERRGALILIAAYLLGVAPNDAG
jgi:hypothetical protein